MQKRIVGTLLLTLAAAACGGSSDRDFYAEALRRDLALAANSAGYANPYMSPMEAGYMQQPGYGAPQYGYPPVYQPVQARVPQPVMRSPAPVYSPAPAPAPASRRGEIIQRNTGRDAAIGAVAGAAIGAVTSRDKLKGAVIGAAAGGLLGGIIGHTVDVKRRH